MTTTDPASPASDPSAATTTAAEVGPPPRPRVSTLAGLVAGCAGLVGLVLLGGIVVLSLTARAALTRVERDQSRRLSRLDEQAASLHEAAALLDEVSEWLHAARAGDGRFPRAMRELPPPDPWGNALLYTVSGLDRAELRCAGPDGELDTIDDLVRTLEPR